MDEVEGEYRVGRGRPPLHTRFKKGQSGNPRGPRPPQRPAGAARPRSERAGGRHRERRASRRITKREAVVAQLVDKSTGADLRATQMLIDMLKDIEKRAGTPPQAPALTPADEEVVENLLARLRRAEMAKIHHGDTEDTE